MGFRSVMITEDIQVMSIPDWFLEKYPNITGVKTEKGMFFPLSTKGEQKFYSSFEETDLFKDIQGLLKESPRRGHAMNLILLHECEGITKVVITEDSIRGLEPTEWKEVKSVTHDYCYGCSDLKRCTSVEGEGVIDIYQPRELSADAIEPAEPLKP